ncbi:MAG: carbonic anhydrase [Anaerolineae bacterium]
MRKMATLSLVAVLSLTLGLVALASEGAHWGYDGEEGPAHWGDLSPDYAACSEGMEQSPIDIPADAILNPADIVFNYQPTAVNIVNNGHSIMVTADPGSSIQIHGKTYNLLQFHFHALSEHTVGGDYYDMEGHFVHQSADGQYAVVGVLMRRGAENAAYAPVWDNMPAEEGETETIEGVTVDPAALLPADQTYWHYHGSFTTPPCTEGVMWFVLNNAVELSDAQIGAFEAIYDHNYRPVLPLNARTFLITADEHPETMPETGGAALPIEGLLLGLGTLTAAAGVYLRRRKAA